MADMTTSQVEKKSEKKKDSFFSGVKSEFKKIIWPTKIASTIVLGAIIAVLDLGIQNLIGNVL